jgi:hypothetical protein
MQGQGEVYNFPLKLELERLNPGVGFDPLMR